MADSAKTKHSDSDDDDLSSVMDVDEVKEIKVIQNIMLEKYDRRRMKKLVFPAKYEAVMSPVWMRA